MQLSLFDAKVEIALTQNQVALIDPSNIDLLDYRWYALKPMSSSGFYATRVDGSRTRIYLHRLIMERKLGRTLSADEQVDHIDGNTLNNRCSNLRVVNHSQNQLNSHRRADNTSGYKGVCLYRGKWRAYFRCEGKQKHLGDYPTPELAYAARCEASLKYHAEYARLA